MNRKPDNTTDKTNLSVPTPALPAKASTGPASGFRCGAIWRNAAPILFEAWFHSS